MTRKHLLANMDDDELIDWLAYDAIQPFGDLRNNLHAGIIAATVANCHSRDGGFVADDFMVKEKTAPTEKQQRQLAEAEAIRIKRKGKKSGH